MNYAELREECELDGIGPLFWELLLAVCGRVARRYPPAVYNHGEPWNDESLSDLAQDVALQRLLDEKENQLEYVLRLATDEDSLARLLAFQIRRVLSHRRALTVVDRLSNRIVKLAAAAPFADDQLHHMQPADAGDGCVLRHLAPQRPVLETLSSKEHPAISERNRSRLDDALNLGVRLEVWF